MLIFRLREDSLNLCTELSPKKSDEIRNQMLYRYNSVLLKMSIVVLETCREMQ